MKLRNKKTGEIHEITEVVPLHDMNKKFVIYSKTEGHNYAYKNLAELNTEWEDYEEPKELKEHYFITEYGNVFPMNVYEEYVNVEDFDRYKQIGNYFDSREEAEKAVEKLKAAKRLKDKGFRFDNFVRNAIYYKLSDEEIEKDDVLEDLDLLFGGEE